MQSVVLRLREHVKLFSVARNSVLLYAYTMTKKQTRVQEGRWTVQFKDADFRRRLTDQAKKQELCVATLIRRYVKDGLAVDERKSATSQ